MGAKQRRFQRDMSRPSQELTFEVGLPDAGRRLDVFLAERISWRSRSQVRELIEQGRVSLMVPGGGKGRAMVPIPGRGRLRAASRVVSGVDVRVRLDAAFVEDAQLEARPVEPQGTAAEAPSAHQALPIVYEDDLLLAVNKPPGVGLYPTRRHRAGSLIERLHREHPRDPPPSPCHRLDRETSGVLVFAKSLGSRAHLGVQFEARTVRKTYQALVRGLLGSELGARGTIDLPLGRSPDSLVEIKTVTVADGRTAQTEWCVLRHLADCTLLEVVPRTGRQHQIRAHLAAIGHPILGDKLYLGGDALFLCSLERELTREELWDLGMPRQALHASALELEHPASGRRLRLEAPLWPDMLARVA